MPFCAYGAPVTMGCNAGVAARAPSELSHVVVVHGCAHDLELASRYNNGHAVRRVPQVIFVLERLAASCKVIKNAGTHANKVEKH